MTYRHLSSSHSTRPELTPSILTSMKLAGHNSDIFVPVQVVYGRVAGPGPLMEPYI